MALRLAAECDEQYVPSFDDINIIHGHRRLFDEVVEILPAFPQLVYDPVGGGGLLAAAVLALRRFTSQVVGVELASARAKHLAIRARRPVQLPMLPPTQAEGLAVHQLGALPLRLLLHGRVRMMLVDSADLSSAMRWIWQRTKIRVQAAGAAAVAGALRDHHAGRVHIRLALCVLTGGNIDETLWHSVVYEKRDIS